jgi:LuxR family transcriptional regulator, maltose regulon positive regulatory protein
VSAPAGWGKTALLSDWANSGAPPGPVAWPELGPDHDSPEAFWGAVTSALAAARPELEGLVSPEGLDVAHGPVVLVVDDLQEVASREIVYDLDRLIAQSPANLRVVVATRVDPPLRLHRLRLAGALGEVRGADLALDRPELQSVLEAAGVELDEHDLDLLLERTEGWPAAVRLAAMSLEEVDDRHDFVRRFAGDDRALSDYLFTEVLSRQRQALFDFLIRTSVAERLTGQLAALLAGDPDGDVTLTELASRHGLVDALDAHGEWYRYHPLLREALRLELGRRYPDEIPLLHRQAASWYAERRLPMEALRHAVESRHWPLVAELVGRHWLALAVRGHAAQLRELMTRIPRAVVDGDAELSLAAAGLRLEGGTDRGADELLVRAYEHALELEPPRRVRFGVTSAVISLYRARVMGDPEEALSAARIALGEPWEEAVEDDVRALAFANLGIAELMDDQAEPAERHLEQAAGLAQECGNEHVELLADAFGAAAAMRSGRVQLGEERAHRALAIAERRGWVESGGGAQALLVLGVARLWAGHLDAAEQFVDQAQLAAAGSGDRFVASFVATVQARVLILRGRPVEALDMLGSVSGAPRRPPRLIAVPVMLFEADAWLALGEPDRSGAVLDAIAEDGEPDVALARAKLHLIAGEPDRALQQLEAFHECERAPILPIAHCQAFVLEAIVRDALGDEDAALGALERALDLAEPRGFAGVIARFGASLRSLLRRAIERGTSHRALAGELLAILEGPAGEARPAAAELLEPLSERELAVLRFLPTMLSNAEIGAEMFVSPNTVKTHLKHIYRKLDVADRREAVRRARELHLLSPSLHER